MGKEVISLSILLCLIGLIILGCGKSSDVAVLPVVELESPQNAAYVPITASKSVNFYWKYPESASFTLRIVKLSDRVADCRHELGDCDEDTIPNREDNNTDIDNDGVANAIDWCPEMATNTVNITPKLPEGCPRILDTILPNSSATIDLSRFFGPSTPTFGWAVYAYESASPNSKLLSSAGYRKFTIKE